MHSENRLISRQASPIKSAHSEQCVTSKCYQCSIPVNRDMAKPLMVDHCNTFTSHNCLRFPSFGIIFKEVFGWKNKKNEYSKNTEKLPEFLSHIKSTWLKVPIYYTFTKFSKSLHISFKPCTTKKWILPECLRKKYEVADYQYFKNGNTQQSNIFRHNKYNFQLVVCEFKLNMSNVTKVMNLRRVMDQTGLIDNQTTNLYTSIFYHPSPFWPIIPLMVITLVTFDILDWNFTHT